MPRFPFPPGRLLLLCTILLAQAVRADESTPKEPITDLGQLWQLPAGETHLGRFEGTVLYCDAEWNALWVKSVETISYLSLDQWPKALEPGDQGVIEGTISGRQSLVKGSTVSLSGERRLPDPLPLAGAWASLETPAPRWVTLNGTLREWRDGGGSRATLELEASGTSVKVWWKGDASKPKAHVEDGVAITGVLVHHREGEREVWELWSPGLLNVTAPSSSSTKREAPRVDRGEPRTITSFSEFWQIPSQGPSRETPVKLTMTVLYHDADWKSLWAKVGDTVGYLPLGMVVEKQPFGNRVRLDARLEPGKGRLLQEPKFSVMDEPEMLTARVPKKFSEEYRDLADQFVQVEGFVDRQVQPDHRHLRLETIVDGVRVTLYVLRPAEDANPDFEGAFIKVRGVFCISSDLAGRPTKPEMCVDSTAFIEKSHRLSEDTRFRQPAVNYASLSALPPDKPVRVTGTVWVQNPGVSLTIGRGEETLRLATAQTLEAQVGSLVEAVGYPKATPEGWIIDRALFRPLSKSAANAERLPTLNVAAQIRRLNADDARRNYSVQLSGVVTWSHPSADFFFLSDATGGVRVQRPPGMKAPVPGEMANVVGVSEAGDFAPVVVATQVQAAGSRLLPEPHVVTLEQALTGIEEAQWVVMDGYVRSVQFDHGWQRLELASSAGEFSCFFPESMDVSYLVGSVVRIPGVCSAETNDRRQLKSVRLWVPTIASISIDEPRPDDPFSVPARTMAELRQFGTWQTTNRRVRVQGVVIHQAASGWVQLADGQESLRVLCREKIEVKPGERIEAVGFPGRENARSVLREAVWRRLSLDREPVAKRISNQEVDTDLDGQLVSLDGRLLDVGSIGPNTRLLIQSAGRVFEAVLEHPLREADSSWQQGASVEVTGLYSVSYDELKRPASTQVLLRTPGDVRVTKNAPWLTTTRAFGTLVALTAAAVGGWLWSLSLRRQVRQQTEQIRVQLQNEKAARLDAALARASKLESLGILAGGIAHDFNNLLTIIIGNLSLVRLDHPQGTESAELLEDTEKATLRARDLTQQLLTFSKGGEPIREAALLSEIVRESASFALHGSNVRCEFDIAEGLWPANIDRGQIGQVVQNIVINARQSMPAGGIVRLQVRNTEIEAGTSPELAGGRYLSLEISDNGQGIPADVMPRIFEPYFTTRQQGNGLGLATVFSIVKRHLGHITVESTLGVGTHFKIWLPAADTAPVQKVPEVSGTLPSLSGRVLFLDDEAPIRTMTSALLKRMGLVVTAVADGHDVTTEYARAKRAGTPYDLVILDLTIPGGLGGAEAMEQLLRVDPGVVAIVSSGYSSNSVLANYRDYGFRAMVAKPYNYHELAQAIQRVLASPTR